MEIYSVLECFFSFFFDTSNNVELFKPGATLLFDRLISLYFIKQLIKKLHSI